RRRDAVNGSMSALDAHLENFRRLNGPAPGTLRALRERALARFTEFGFPTTRLEDWKYTNVAPLAERAFHLPDERAARGAEALAEGAQLGTGIELVFVTGRYVEALSHVGHLPPGAVVANLDTALHKRPELIEPHLGRYAAFDQAPESLTALNTAF